LVLDGGLWSFYPWGKSPRYPLGRKLDGARSVPNVMAKRKILGPAGNGT